MSSRQLNRLILALGSLCSALGLFMLLVWKMGLMHWLTVDDRFTVAMADTALAIGVAGLGLIAHIQQRPRLLSVLGIVVAVIALSSGLEYLLATNLPLNDFLFNRLLGLEINRMGPNTALALGMIGLGQVLLGRVPSTPLLRATILGLASTAASLGLVAIIGYLSHHGMLYGWGRFTAMSPYAAIGILLLASTLALTSLRQGIGNHLHSIAILAVAAVFAVTLLIWHALNRNEEANHQIHIDRLTEAIAQAIDTDLKTKVLALDRMAQRWEQASGTPRPLFQTDAMALARDQGFQAVNWADANGVLRWVNPLAGNETAVNFDLARDARRRQSLAAAQTSRAIVFTPPIAFIQGGTGVAAFRALYVGGRLDGYLSAPVRLDRILERAARPLLPPHTQATLQADGKTIAAFGQLDGAPTLTEHDHRIHLGQIPGTTIQVDHDAAYRESHASALPILVLISGLITAGLLGAALWFWQAALARARESEAAARHIHDREARLKAIVDTAAEGIITIDERGGVETMNPAAEMIFGYRVDEVVGRNIKMLMPEPYRSAHDGYLHRYTSGGTPCLTSSRELAGQRKDGSTFPMELAVSEMHLDDKRMFTGLVRDISERKQSEQVLQQERDFSAALFSAAGALMVVLDRKGHIVRFNQAAEQITGYRSDEVTGKPVWDFFILPKERGAVSAVFENLKAGTIIKRYENHWLMRDGSIRLFDWSNAVLTDEHGNVAYIVTLGVDITERKQAEAELILAKETAEQASRAKSLFLSSMSHELRTPLNAILGYAQLFELDSALSSTQQEHVHEIHRAGELLLRLINDVLNLARIEAGHLDLTLADIDPRTAVSECLQLSWPLATRFGIQLEQMPAPAGLPNVRTDHTRLKQVLLNLISNAIKYNKQGGTVNVSIASGHEDTVRLIVTDNGPGIAAARLNDIFKPFNRAGLEASNVEGTGIGLTITRQLIEAMGGNIGVHSQPGEGSTFWIDLPTCDATATAIATEATHAAPANIEVPHRAHTILYIEDNASNLKLVEGMLKKRPKYTLLAAMDPQTGLETAEREQPDLILLDINLPDMDGYQVLERLRASATTRTIPVLAVTANALAKDIERSRQAGFDDYLTKPLYVSDFLSKVDDWIEKRH